MNQSLKSLLKQEKLVRVFCVGQLASPKLIEMVAYQGGFDGVWLDQEHAGLTIEQIEHMARGARASGLDSFVRLTATDYATVMRPLEAGAGGIMAAQVRSASQVEQIVQWAKFYPRGLRGVNANGVDGRYGAIPLVEYARQVNAESLVAVQIEHVDALEEVEQIAAVKDLDLLFIGPADLTQSMGLLGEWNHPRLWQGIERVARAAHDHGIHWACLPLGPAFARRCVELGCKMLSFGMDVWFVNKGVQAFRAEYAEFF